MKLQRHWPSFTKAGVGTGALYASLRARHRARLIDADLIKKYALTEEQQNRVREAVAFKRAFHRLEDQCMWAACKIDPKLHAEVE